MAFFNRRITVNAAWLAAFSIASWLLLCTLLPSASYTQSMKLVHEYHINPSPSILSDRTSRQAFVTMYIGTKWDSVIALAFGLLDVNSSYPLVVAYVTPPDKASAALLSRLGVRTHSIAELPIPRNPDISEAWHLSWTKLQLWGLYEHYDKLVYLDTDILPLRNIDELMDFPALSVTNGQVSPCETAWGINAGVFVFAPDRHVHQIYTTHAFLPEWARNTEQTFLGLFTHPDVPRLHYLSSIYNTAVRSCTCLTPDQWHDVKMVHFVATAKPWEEKGTETCYAKLAGVWRRRLSYAKQLV